MTTAFAQTDRPSLKSLATTFSPKGGRFDPFGLVTGMRAYQIFSDLDAKGDAELATLGLVRSDLPRAAMDAAQR